VDGLLQCDLVCRSFVSATYFCLLAFVSLSPRVTQILSLSLGRYLIHWVSGRRYRNRHSSGVARDSPIRVAVS